MATWVCLSDHAVTLTATAVVSFGTLPTDSVNVSLSTNGLLWPPTVVVVSSSRSGCCNGVYPTACGDCGTPGGPTASSPCPHWLSSFAGDVRASSNASNWP